MANIKHFQLHLSVSLTLGAFMLCQVFPPAQAQTAQSVNIIRPLRPGFRFRIRTRQSDISGTNVTGSNHPFPSQIQQRINQAAGSVQSRLQNNDLTSPQGQPITQETQQDLLRLLTAANVKDNRKIAKALTSGENSLTEAQARQLINSLHGLIAKGNDSQIQVSPYQLVQALNAYNNLIDHSSAQFLKNPPPALNGINSVLSQLSQPLLTLSDSTNAK